MATQEVFDLRRRLAEANPPAFEPDLARALWGYAWVRVAAGIDLKAALTAIGKSVTIYQALAERN